MLTLNEIINASFRKSNFSGYRPEDVDTFLDEVKESYEMLIKKNIEQKETNDTLTAENERLEKENKELAVKVEQYQQDADEIKNALISAQKLGDAAIREARHKAEIILKDANLKAEKIVTAAQMEILDQKEELEDLKQLVSDFRANLLDMYKEHLTLIKSLPASRKSRLVEAPDPLSAVPPLQQEEEDPAVPEPASPQEEPAPQEPPAGSVKPPLPAVDSQPTQVVPMPKAMPEDMEDPFPPHRPEPSPSKVTIHSQEDEEATKSFVIGEDKGRPKTGKELRREARDLRYDVLNFGEEDLESPSEKLGRHSKSR